MQKLTFKSVLSTIIFSVEMNRSTSVLGCDSPSGACGGTPRGQAGGGMVGGTSDAGHASNNEIFSDISKINNKNTR